MARSESKINSQSGRPFWKPARRLPGEPSCQLAFIPRGSPRHGKKKGRFNEATGRQAFNRSRQLGQPDRTVIVAIERKARPWTSVPAAAAKPFAWISFGVLSHIVALFGMRWIEFGRKISSGSVINGFHAIGCHRDRVDIVADKKGNSPCVFPGKLGPSRITQFADVSVVFQMIGMVAHPLHLSGTPYRHMPNPTIFPWPKPGPPMAGILRCCGRELIDDLRGFYPDLTSLETLLDSDLAIESTDIDNLDLLHQQLDSLTLMIRTTFYYSYQVARVISSHFDAVAHVAKAYSQESGPFAKLRLAKPYELPKSSAKFISTTFDLRLCELPLQTAKRRPTSMTTCWPGTGVFGRA